MFFTPKKFPSLTVYFYGSQGQEATFDDPGFDDEIEFIKIKVDDTRLDRELEDHLIEEFEADWINELNELKFERD